VAELHQVLPLEFAAQQCQLVQVSDIRNFVRTADDIEEARAFSILQATGASALFHDQVNLLYNLGC